jgi:hypothetical protein
MAHRGPAENLKSHESISATVLARAGSPLLGRFCLRCPARQTPQTVSGRIRGSVDWQGSITDGIWQDLWFVER